MRLPNQCPEDRVVGKSPPTHQINDPIKVLQSLRLEDTRVHVVLKVSVVDLIGGVGG